MILSYRHFWKTTLTVHPLYMVCYADQDKVGRYLSRDQSHRTAGTILSLKPIWTCFFGRWEVPGYQSYLLPVSQCSIIDN